jgi:integrase
MEFDEKSKRPKMFDLLIPGLGVGAGRSKDRFRVSSETRDKKEYQDRERIIRDVAKRLLWRVLRARLEGRFTTTDLCRAYREGDAALTALAEQHRGVMLAPLRDQFIKVSVTRDKEKYRKQLTRFIQAVGGDGKATTDDLTTTKIANFLAELKDGRKADESDASNSTKNRYRAALGGFATWLIRHGHIHVHPIAHKRIPKWPEPEGRLPEFSTEDYRNYFAHATDDDPAVVLLLKLLIHTGADVGEVFGAEVSDARLDRRPAHLRFKRPKTHTPERHVPIPAAITADLRGHIAEHDLKGYDALFSMVPRKQVVALHTRLRQAIHKEKVTLKTFDTWPLSTGAGRDSTFKRSKSG